MRLQEILNENLEWHGNEQEKFMSLKGLVNKNDGVYKSRKQQWFLTNKLIYKDEMLTDRGFAKSNFGVDLDDGEALVHIDHLQSTNPGTAGHAAGGAAHSSPALWNRTRGDGGSSGPGGGGWLRPGRPSR